MLNKKYKTTAIVSTFPIFLFTNFCLSETIVLAHMQLPLPFLSNAFLSKALFSLFIRILQKESGGKNIYCNLALEEKEETEKCTIFFRFFFFLERSYNKILAVRILYCRLQPYSFEFYIRVYSSMHHNV